MEKIIKLSIEGSGAEFSLLQVIGMSCGVVIKIVSLLSKNLTFESYIENYVSAHLNKICNA